MTTGRKTAMITGVGMITAAGMSALETWEAMVEGRPGIRGITSFPTAGYRVKVGGEVDRSRLDANIDVTLALARAAAREALFDAGLDPGGRVGLVVGTNMGLVTQLEGFCRGEDELASLAPLGDLAARLGEELGIGGPVITSSCSCASGACALGIALQLLREGWVDAVVAGAADALSEFKFSGHHLLGSMTRETMRPFDLNRSGMLLGEGAGFLVLEPDGSDRAYAVLAGYGTSNDAHHLTAPDLSGRGAALAIRAALSDAGVSDSTVDYVNAHGTATRHNDAMEAAALRLVLGDRATTVPTSSQKPIVGHLLGAAPAVEAIVTALAIRYQLIPPTINFTVPDPDCPVDCVPGAARGSRVRVALSNSFGLGGVNACLVLTRCGE